MRRARRRHTYPLLLLGAFFLAFLLVETAVRLVKPNIVRMRLLHEADRKLGFRLKSNATTRYRTGDFDTVVRINAAGLRDREHQEARAPGTYRILILGDSFTMGLGVNLEEAYPSLLEKTLNETRRGPVGFEVINAGVDGYGTEQEFLYLQELALRYRPDLVVVGFYFNDIYEVLQGIPAMGGKAWVKSHLHSVSYAQGLASLAGKILRKRTEAELLEPFLDNPTPRFTSALEETKGYLLKIRDFSRSVGAETAVVLIPLCLEVDRSEWVKRNTEALYSERLFFENIPAFSAAFVEFGKANHLPTLSLLASFRNSPVRPLYFNRDPHWNRDGHRLAAAVIAPFLRENNLLQRH